VGGVVRYVDLDPLRFDRAQDVGQIPVSQRIVEIGRERVVVREADDEGVCESVVRNASSGLCPSVPLGM
jgi:hypothetical protein